MTLSRPTAERQRLLRHALDNRRMKLSGALLALGAVVLLGTTAGTAATGGGGRIVFASGLPAYPPPANLNVSRIYSIGVDGRGRRNIGGTPGEEASLSPDRTKIAYLRDGGLWVMNADGSSQRRLLLPEPLQSFYGGELAWSPDGTKLAVNMQYESPCPGPIAANKCWPPSVSGVVVDLDGAVVGGTGFNPAWSPDGKQIVSAVDQSGSPDDRDWQIVVSSLDGAPDRELTQGIAIPEYACWSNPSWSPDGTRIAASLLDCDNGFDDVWTRSYLFPVGTGPPRVIVGATPPVWSPDGTKLAFLRQHVHSDGYVDGTALYVARGDGSQARALSAADPSDAPVWAPKGGRLTYTSRGTGQIETIGADGNGRRRATHELADSFLTPFAWSGDAGRILYTAAVTPEHSHIWTMSPAGTDFKRLTRSRRDEGDPAWSPDGRQIAFTRWFAPNEHADPIGAIYTIRRDGTHEKHLLGGSKAGYSASSPAWSPNGKRLAFVRTSLDFESIELIVANADGSHARRIAEDVIDSAPAWSPDGRRIAYASGGTITLVNPNGGRKATTVPAGDDCTELAWSPDGRRFALVCGYLNTDKRRVYVMNVDGSDLRRVVEDTRATSPTWSPDGATIVFAGVTCHPPGWFDASICAVGADGSGLRELTPFRAISSSPNWSTARAGPG
jgi:TolB protein